MNQDEIKRLMKIAFVLGKIAKDRMILNAIAESKEFRGLIFNNEEHFNLLVNEFTAGYFYSKEPHEL